jgi:hypothetical protein
MNHLTPTQINQPFAVHQPLLALLLGLVLLLCLYPAAQAQRQLPACPPSGTQRLYVQQDASGANSGLDWSDALPTLQDALWLADPENCAATAVAQIWVAAGVYYPDEGAGQQDNDRDSSFQLRSGLALYGGFAGTPGTEDDFDSRDWEANVTVLSGDIDQDDVNLEGSQIVKGAGFIRGNNAYHVVTGSGADASAILDGFTITAGKTPSGEMCPAACGGGMLNVAGAPTLANLSFQGNSASGGAGGGMANWGGSSPTLTNVTFGGNSAGSGGGVYNDNSSPELTYVFFDGNSSEFFGGGMANWESSHPTLTHVTFSENSARRIGGGGMFNYQSNPVLANVSFLGNSVIYSGGGGIFNEESNPTLTNVAFSGNWAYYGGGIFNWKKSSPTLTNVTVSANLALVNGGGIFNDNSSPTIVNSIFWNNRDLSSTAATAASIVNQGRSAPTFRNSLVQGCNPRGRWNRRCGNNGERRNGNNLADVDPRFVAAVDPEDAPTTAGDLRLQAASPAIDQGSNRYVEGVPTDLEANPRISGRSVDLGAYERQ